MVITITEQYTIITCCQCHVPFGMSKSLYSARKRDGEIFYCPSGHRQHFTESDEVVEKRKREELQRQLSNRELELMMARNAHSASERKLKSTQRKLKRTETRISKGICPCCNRQFVNLHRHIEGQHPEYTGEK